MGKSRTQKRKKTNFRTRKRRVARKQRGGLPVQNTIRFRYTKKSGRGEWIDALYPLSPIILQAIRELDWSTFRFRGESEIGVWQETDRLGFNANNYRRETALVEATSVRPPQWNIPYIIFGGAACELWNKAYPDAGNLHETTDPTGDIDIKVAVPYCKIHGEYLDDSTELFMFDSKGNYTPLADSYTRWIHTLGIQLATTIVPQFSPKWFVLPDKDDMEETSIADMEEAIGPILVTRSHVNDMIKVQLSTKLQSGQADHFIEFILVTPEPFEAQKNELRGIQLLNGLYVESAYLLFKDQLQGLRGRLEINEPGVYKLINHYGRLIYLAKLHEYTTRNKLDDIQGTGYYNDIINFIDEGGFAPSRGCIPQIGCSLENFVATLCKIPRFRMAYKRCAE